MKIKVIEINNYKAFYGKQKINVGGKNLFIYGENGSGKSSLYYALKDFFQSSIEDIDLNELENIFITDAKKGNSYIKVTFNPDSEGKNRNQSFQLAAATKDTDSGADTSIRDANKLKSFLTYKHLLEIHHIQKGRQIDLFNLLVNGVLKHFRYTLTNGKKLGELWQVVETHITKTTDISYNLAQKKKDVNAALKAFNDAFSELFKTDSPEYILKHANPILDRFNHNLEIKLAYRQAKPDSDYQAIENNHVHIDLTYAGKKIAEPHLFLNEARLSAIAISVYLGMIKRHIQGIPCKILFLDDIFIGLDIANRLPLLDILKSEFPDYQIFITTYDKPWYEYAKSYLEGVENWKTLEFYAQETKEGFEIPLINDDSDFLQKTERYCTECDYKAAAVYTRSAFEKILRKYCQDKKKKIIFKSRLKDYTTEDFWHVVKEDVDSSIQAEIEKYRTLVLNPFSHYNTEKHEIKTELKDAMEAVKNLKNELNKIA
ncbi:AAA family ATPase [Methylobacter sp.]|uniref:AAA family ATPase n=1 Tax=Methylobacter sp. TaxID=2051955 RepID=UPI00248A3919|nr:AAA family ATPase [Methylobacter sp.]MDI1278844.1 AAA family ATPase [Methylobacter sp.]MDI1359677.1 AAA family ATPase [Methylobacter sp.]